MARHVAFLRGISPMNAKMPELKRAFEGVGFSNVKTVLGSGNVVFDTRGRSESALARQAEAAMQETLGHSFLTIVRSVKAIDALIEADPFAEHDLPADAKRVVTFLREPSTAKLALPHERDGVRILKKTDREIFTAYTPHPRGPVFMAMLEKTFGTDITTRTWDTVKKCARA